MKRVLMLVLGLLLICTVAFALDSKFKPGSEPDGFRGIKWGTDISTLQDMKHYSTDSSYGGIENYTKKKDKLKIGGANIDRIIYGFWRGKFSSVDIYIEGYVNWAGLKKVSFEKFGKGLQLSEYIEEYYWFGETTNMRLKYNEISEVGRLYVWSKVIEIQQVNYDKQKAKEK